VQKGRGKKGAHKKAWTNSRLLAKGHQKKACETNFPRRKRGETVGLKAKEE